MSRSRVVRECKCRLLDGLTREQLCDVTTACSSRFAGLKVWKAVAKPHSWAGVLLSCVIIEVQ
jgi:hypothetical protein